MAGRLDQLRNRFAPLGVEAFLVSDLTNIRYLCGYSGSNGLLLVAADRSVFLTDFRYQQQVKTEVKGPTVSIANRNLFDDVVALPDLARVKKLGIEAHHLTVQAHNKLAAALPAVELVACANVVSEIRSVKEPAELAKIKTAVAVTDRVFKRVLNMVKPGVSEKDLGLEVDFLLKQEGDGISFPTIVVSGPRSALPHGQPSNRRLKKGDFVTFDMGATWRGYAADFTRTVVVGKPTPKHKKIYAIVLEAQLRAIDGIKAGVTCQAADGFARDHIAGQGFGDYFGHSLGHGIGMGVHELPTLSAKSDATLAANNVVTVEPGIYLPGWGGVRIEDVVVVKEKGCTLLTKTTKRLVAV